MCLVCKLTSYHLMEVCVSPTTTPPPSLALMSTILWNFLQFKIACCHHKPQQPPSAMHINLRKLPHEPISSAANILIMNTHCILLLDVITPEQIGNLSWFYVGNQCNSFAMTLSKTKADRSLFSIIYINYYWKLSWWKIGRTTFIFQRVVTSEDFAKVKDYLSKFRREFVSCRNTLS